MNSRKSSFESSQHDLRASLLTENESSDLHWQTLSRKTQTRSLVNFLPWVLCLMLSTCLVLPIALNKKQCGTSNPPSYYWREREFKIDMNELALAFQDIQFDATLKYNGSHQLYRPVTSPSFVGPPNVELDAAWEDLLGVVQIFITPDEAKSLDGQLWIDPEAGLPMAVVTGFHDLHCLNMLRKAIYTDSYPELWTQEGIWPHIEHCIDSLRLSLMCTADMTLIPIEWSDNRNWIMPKFETVHTCRDYSALKEWALDRDSVDEDHYIQNARKLRAKVGLPPWEPQ